MKVLEPDRLGRQFTTSTSSIHSRAKVQIHTRWAQTRQSSRMSRRSPLSFQTIRIRRGSPTLISNNSWSICSTRCHLANRPLRSSVTSQGSQHLRKALKTRESPLKHRLRLYLIPTRTLETTMDTCSTKPKFWRKSTICVMTSSPRTVHLKVPSTMPWRSSNKKINRPELQVNRMPQMLNQSRSTSK